MLKNQVYLEICIFSAKPGRGVQAPVSPAARPAPAAAGGCLCVPPALDVFILQGFLPCSPSPASPVSPTRL